MAHAMLAIERWVAPIAKGAMHQFRMITRKSGFHGSSSSFGSRSFCRCDLAFLELIDGSRDASNRKVGGTDCERCHAPIQDDNPKEWISWIKFVIRLMAFCRCDLASLELIDGSRNASNRKVGGTD
jgi:hypothetical protein